MIIVLEGPDGCGKSTLAHQLDEELTKQGHDTVVLKFGQPTLECPFEEYEKTLYPHIEAGKTIICDRLHLGERVYGPLLRGHDRLGNDAAWRHVELFLAAHNALVVFPTTPYSELKQRLQRRGDDLISLEQLPNIVSCYEDVLEHTMLNILFVYLRPDDQVMKVLSTIRNRPTYDTSPSTYIGRPNSVDLLICGEQRSDLPDPEFWSAFIPRPKSSGFYLLECLPDPLWRFTGLVNSCEEDVFHRWHTLGEPPVIALGRNASRALVQQAVPHSIVPHPQYVRRFFHKSLMEYGVLIDEVHKSTYPGHVLDAGGWRGEDALEFLEGLAPLKFQTIKQ